MLASVFPRAATMGIKDPSTTNTANPTRKHTWARVAEPVPAVRCSTSERELIKVLPNLGLKLLPRDGAQGVGVIVTTNT